MVDQGMSVDGVRPGRLRAFLVGQETPGRAVLSWVGLVPRLVLGGALLIAGAPKLGRPALVLASVRAYQLPLPDAMIGVIAAAQPVVETVLGILIIAGVWTRVTAALGGLAMLIFIAGIISVWARGLAIDCGCFSDGGTLADQQRTTYVQDILRDTGFLICAIWLVIRPRTRLAVDGWLRRNTDHEEHDDGEAEDQPEAA